MKKLFAILLVLALAVGLCACGDSDSVKFRNDLDAEVKGVFVSPSSELEDWGESVNYAPIRSGSSVNIDFDRFAVEGETLYDVGAVDENELNYDIYEVPLQVGDTMALSVDGEAAILTVTDKDGAVKTYEGYAYDPADLEG